jgi:hypothetical protein
VGPRSDLSPSKNIVPKTQVVSVDMDGPILSRILYTLMPMSQLFCEEVALVILGGNFECILDRVSLYSLGKVDARFM